ncbi:inositol monophosphatase family protein [Pseudoduganella sp. RAF53_2]|uniref:inositol monophosphatase family protein n=1 Tax=unclassified Pseudoduganella TaxID=2637179 RepID=UPI003F9C2E99
MTTLDHSALIKSAVSAVLEASKLADAARATQVLNTKGNLRDIVTQTDLDISEMLSKSLGVTGLPVVSEEADVPGGVTPAQCWVIDPIDGTVNFAHGLPMFALSAGLLDNGQFELGVVCAPALDELYFTLNSERALLNGRPFSHTHRPREQALVAASFSAKGSAAQYELFEAVNESTRGCLRSGTAALNICWAAAGKLQAAYGFNAKLWDVAGALAVARAAGCEIAVRWEPNTLTLDYCVGSAEAVQHVRSLAQSKGLWN